jgi:membrane associated rhomboid family serine protease
VNTTDPIVAQLRRNRAACAAVTMLVILAAIWIVQFANVADSYALDPEFGVQPHVLASLPDIFAAPFLHGSWSHIEGNSVPLLILGFLAAYRSLVKFAWVTAIVVVTSGLFVWLTAPAGSYTVGASAVIAGWLGYVMLRGVFDRRITDIVIGVIAGFLYLGQFEFLPNNSMISWQGHLSGLLTGMLCAWLFRTRKTPVKSTGPPKTIQGKVDH